MNDALYGLIIFIFVVALISLGVFIDIYKWHTFQEITHSNIGFWKWHIMFNTHK